jgi:hypothetical protein
MANLINKECLGNDFYAGNCMKQSDNIHTRWMLIQSLILLDYYAAVLIFLSGWLGAAPGEA